MPTGGGGSSTTTTVDKEYNAGMLKLSQENQKWAEKLFNRYLHGVDYDPKATQQGKTINGKWYSADQLKTMGIKGSGGYMVENPEWVKWNEQNKAGLLNGQMTYGNNGEGAAQYQNQQAPEPQRYIENKNALETRTLGDVYGYDPDKITSEAEYAQNVITANQSLLGDQTATEAANLKLTQEQIAANRNLLGQKTKVANRYIGEVLKGQPIGRQMNQAQAGVQQAYDNTMGQMKRQMFTSGVNPNDPVFASTINARNLSLSKDIAAARETAKDKAEQTNLTNLRDAMSTGF